MLCVLLYVVLELHNSQTTALISTKFCSVIYQQVVRVRFADLTSPLKEFLDLPSQRRFELLGSILTQGRGGKEGRGREGVGEEKWTHSVYFTNGTLQVVIWIACWGEVCCLRLPCIELELETVSYTHLTLPTILRV